MTKYRFEQIAFNSTEKKKPEENDRHVYLGLEHLDSGCLKVTRFGADVAPIGDKLVMRKGDVLFGKRRAYQKKVAIAPFDGIFSAHGMVLRPRENAVDPQFFPFFISSDYFLDAAIKISVGSLSPTINWRDLKNLEFNLPSLEEQRRLASVLQSITDTIETYKNLLTKTDELVKSQFIELFGDPVKNPSDFPKRTIGECCILKSGTTLPEELENEGGEIPYIKVADMNIEGNEGYITTSTRFVSEKSAGSGIFPYGAVIFPKRGGAILTNKKRMVLRPICADLNIMGVISKGELNPFYLKVFFDSLDLASILNGSTIPQINNKDIAPLCILVPPIAQQSRFADFVQQLDKSKFELEQALSELTLTYKRILAENLG